MTIPEITAYVMALPVEDVRRLTATEIMGWELKSIKTHNRIDLGPRPVYEDLYCVDGKPYQTVEGWRPDIDRNQSRQVTDRVGYLNGRTPLCMTYVVWAYQGESWDEFQPPDQGDCRHWETVGKMLVATPDQESRAALIAHMIHKETTNETDRDSYRS